MKIRMLGSCGSRLGISQTCSLLINDRMLLDAGSIVSVLTLAEQIAIDDILLTHAHLDHIADLAFLVDNVFVARTSPLRVWAPAPVLQAVKDHVFNDAVWPDFSRLPSLAAPVLQFNPLSETGIEMIGGLAVRWAPTSHPVPSVGYCLTDAQGNTVLFSGDTGITEELWTLGRSFAQLKAAFIETTFPDRLAKLGETSGHLTPATLRGELEKLGRPEIPVKIFHAKAQFLDEIQHELRDLTHLQVLRGGEEFLF